MRNPIQTIKDIRSNAAKLTADLIDNPRGVLEDIIARWDRFSKLPESEKNDFIVKNGSQLITDLIILKAASKAAQAAKAKVLAKLTPKARVLFNSLSKQKELDTVGRGLQKAESEAQVVTPKTNHVIRIGTPKSGTTEIPIKDITPTHSTPRQGKSIPETAKSLSGGYDVSQPIPVLRMPDGKLIAAGGNHRLAAMDSLGESTIPAKLSDWTSIPGNVKQFYRTKFPEVFGGY